MLGIAKKQKKGKMHGKLSLVLGIILEIMIFKGCGNVYATKNNTWVSNIGNPIYRTKEEGNSIYNYVYFGKTGNDGTLYDITSNPILFRVLNTTANDTSNTDCLLLLSEFDIYKTNTQWDDTSLYGNTWSRDSTIKTMLNNNSTVGGTLYDCFTEKEKEAILETTNGEIELQDKISWIYEEDGVYANGCALGGEKLFLLSAKEAVNQNYGFARIEDGGNMELADDNRIAKRGNTIGENIDWWLRSKHTHDNNDVAIIDYDGSASSYSSYVDSVGVRFALNVNIADIIYTSSASEGTIPSSNEFVEISKSAPSVAAICTLNYTPSDDTIRDNYASKLTLLDTSRSTFNVTESEITSIPRGLFVLNYTGAQTNSNSTNEYISAIIKDEHGNGIYYGAIKTSENVIGKPEGAGELEVELPNLEPGNYTLMILNEQRNKEKETNYAGFDTVDLCIENIARKAILTATDNESGLWKIVATPSAKAKPLYTFVGEAKTQTVVFNVPSLDLEEVYIVDFAGNVSETITLEEDTTPPSYRVIRTSDGIKISVTDEGAGLYKVEDRIYDDYPLSIVNYDVENGETLIEVEDALGNVSTIDLTEARCVIIFAHKSVDDEKMVLNIIDTRGIEKLGVVDEHENEKIIEKFENGNKIIRKGYDIPCGIVKLRVYCKDNYMAEISLDDNETVYAIAPSVTNGVIYSEVGIGKIVYNGKIKISFTQETPVKIDANTDQYESIEVYDVLGNKSVIVE